AKIAPKAVWAEIAQRPVDVFEYERPDEKDSSPKRTDYISWRNAFATRRFVAFCGLGAPAGFRKTLARENLDVRSFIPFPDHCAYSEDDYRRILDEAARVNADAFVVTLKDFVKLREFISQSPAPVFALGVGIEFLTGQEQFEVLISAAIKARSYN
ncbi:MAG: tetraacyldisaccharide 4'-kinase, partial [Thermoguttaceae bacterium]|nr:tetraacyldisaccharide 4'-kinase [Thermoguttaceae bacterium]